MNQTLPQVPPPWHLDRRVPIHKESAMSPNHACLVALVLFTAACGPNPVDEPLTDYVVEGAYIRSEVPLDIAAVTAAFKEARTVLARRVPVERLEFLIAASTFYVVREDKWGADGAGGKFDPLGGITLASHMKCLRHELLHAWDWSNYAVGTVGHEHWDTNGYRELWGVCGIGSSR